MSSISSFVLGQLRDIPPLTEKTWHLWHEGMKMFAMSASIDWLEDENGNSPAAVPDDPVKIALDKQLVGLFYGRISTEYRRLVTDKMSGLAAWKAIKAYFEKSTMARRIKARTEFDQVFHDPAESVDVYIHAVEVARTNLAGLNITIDNDHTKDVLLRNLDSSFDTIRTSILSAPAEPTLETIKATLSSSASAIMIKAEPIELAQAARGGNGRGYGQGKKAVVSGGGNGDAGLVDSKGFHWCDLTNSGCHRCGHNGHTAHTCIYDMPQEIKDAVMSRSRQEVHEAQELPVHFASAAAVDEEFQGDQDFKAMDGREIAGDGWVLHV